MKKQLTNWWLKYRTEIGLSLVLFILAWVIRTYSLSDNLFFGFEQGRDAEISYEISQLKDFVLVGPKTDIDGLFHGAWYYYLMAIPYGLSGGDPLVSSLFLVLLSSLVPVVMFWLLKDMTKSTLTGLVAGLLTVISYEYIIYSRWLSNVTPAVLGVALTFGSLWLYRKTEKARWFVAAVLAASLACQFEIILVLELGLAFGVLLLSRWLKWPGGKAWLSSAVVVGIIFLPMMLFNVRNEFITFTSIQKYLASGHSEPTLGFNQAIASYSERLSIIFRNSLLNIRDWRFQVLGLLILVGSLWLGTQKKERYLLVYFGVWMFMTLPLIFFPRSLSLPQLYVGTGLGLIGLVAFLIDHVRKTRPGLVVSFLVLALITSGLPQTFNNLRSNSDVFFKTIQDDLRYQDQRALLEYVHTDSQGQPYRFTAYTIPYFQEHGWRYLHRYWYPAVTDLGAGHIYVVIEEKVDPFWEKKWLEELGKTELVEERRFGLLRVQKRKLL